MILDNTPYCANNDESLLALKGEVIKGFMYDREKLYFVFESGWGFCIKTDNGAHWIVSRSEIRSLIDERKKALDASGFELNRIVNMAGERA